jgi:UDPglucose 6-dehydrogenase
MKISFVGLGKLGLPLATNFAKNGHTVVAIDKNKSLISTLKKTKSPWEEFGLQENLNLAKANISYTTEYDSVADTDVSIILVNTPSVKKDGSFSNVYVEQSIISICEEINKSKKKSHQFILSSTVMPRSIKDTFIPLIESITGWTLNKEFGFSYVPDFVAIGQIIRDFENPDFLLIGSSNDEYGDITEDLYKTIIKNNAQTCKLNLAEAEMAKVSLNAYITTKISFANYLGLLCKKVDSTINVDNITNTIGLDKRIGKRYFKSGGPYGGTCFPRDTWAFEKISEKVGMSSSQMLANEKINTDVVSDIYTQMMVDSPDNIGFIGLGFKPGTSVVTEGVSVKLMDRLKNYSGNIHIYDHLNESIDNFKDMFKSDKVIVHSNVENLIVESDVVVYCNDDSYDVPKGDVKVIDPWRTI